MKTPTQREKIIQYEAFLHKINMYATCGNAEGIRQLVTNADKFSYAHRVGNGELSEKKQQEIINNAFWNLLNEPVK